MTEQEEFNNQFLKLAGKDPSLPFFGTAGNVTKVDPFTGNRSYTTINGKQYAQLNDPSDFQALNETVPGASSQIIYDPTYGYVVPSSVFESPQMQSHLQGIVSQNQNSLGELLSAASAPLAAYGLGQGLEFLGGLGGGASTAAETAGTVTGGGVGGGAGGLLGSSGAYDPALIDAAYSGMGATGVGSTAAGLGTSGGAGLLASASGLPVDAGIAGATGGFTAAQLAAAGIDPTSAGLPTPVGSTATGGASTGATGGTSASTATTGSTALGRLLGLDQNGQDLLSVLGPLVGTGLGLYGANQQQNALQDVANQYLALGAPARQRLEASYQPGFSLMDSDPAFKNALDTAANTSARALSTTYGNPADSPTAQAEMQKYLLGNVELPQLNTYRSQLAGQGGLGINTAGTASTTGALNAGGVANAIGYGAGSLLNPTPDISQLLKQLGTTGQQNKITVGGISL